MTDRMTKVKKEMDALTIEENYDMYQKFFNSMFDEDVDGALEVLIDVIRRVSVESMATMTVFLNKVTDRYDNMIFDMEDEELEDKMEAITDMVMEMQEKENED